MTASYEFKDETGLRRYLARKTYGVHYGVKPDQWMQRHKESLESGRFKICETDLSGSKYNPMSQTRKRDLTKILQSRLPLISPHRSTVMEGPSSSSPKVASTLDMHNLTFAPSPKAMLKAEKLRKFQLSEVSLLDEKGLVSNLEKRMEKDKLTL